VGIDPRSSGKSTYPSEVYIAQAAVGEADSVMESVVKAIRQKTPPRWLTLQEVQADVARDREIREREKLEDRKAFRSLFLLVQAAVRKLEVAHEREYRVASALEKISVRLNRLEEHTAEGESRQRQAGVASGGCMDAMEDNRTLHTELQLRQAEVARLRWVTAGRQEEEVGIFARQRYEAIVGEEEDARAASLYEKARGAGQGPEDPARLQERRAAVDHRLAAEREAASEANREKAVRVGADTVRRWRETGTLPEGWVGFSEELGVSGGVHSWAPAAVEEALAELRRDVQRTPQIAGSVEIVGATARAAAAEAGKERKAVEGLEEVIDELEDTIREGLHNITWVVERMERGAVPTPSLLNGNGRPCTWVRLSRLSDSGKYPVGERAHRRIF
jgi:hypothetical protein